VDILNISKTALGVVAFVLLLVLAGYSAKSSAESFIHLGVGKTLFNSDLKIGEIGYQYGNWEVQASLSEAGVTKRGWQEQVDTYSVSYLTTPGWGYAGAEPYFRFGVSHNSDSNLVGSINYRLGIGVNFNQVFRLEYVHHSSAGIHDPNTGIDYVALNYVMEAPW
jgi:hypothetical protein